MDRVGEEIRDGGKKNGKRKEEESVKRRMNSRELSSRTVDMVWMGVGGVNKPIWLASYGGAGGRGGYDRGATVITLLGWFLDIQG